MITRMQELEAPTSTLSHPDVFLRVLQLVVHDLLARGVENRDGEAGTARATSEAKAGVVLAVVSDMIPCAHKLGSLSRSPA